MSAVLCQNFVQNAWKREFCTNCYRTKHEHPRGPRSPLLSATYLASTTTWQGLALQQKQQKQQQEKQQSERPVCPPLAGILKGGRRSRPPFHERHLGSVGFREESPQVIGYGGGDGDLDWENDEETEKGNPIMNGIKDPENGQEEEGMSSKSNDSDSLENFDLSMEEKEMARLTVKNTEFNSILKNLATGASDAKMNGVAGCANVSGSSTQHQQTISVAVSTCTSKEESAVELNTFEENCEWKQEIITFQSNNEPATRNHNQEDEVEKTKQQLPVTEVSTKHHHSDSSRSSNDSSRCNSPAADPTLVPPPDYMVNDEVSLPVSSLEETIDHQSTSTEPSGTSPNQVDAPATVKYVSVDDKQQQPAMHYSSSSILKGLKAVNSSPPLVSAGTFSFSSCSSSSNETSPVVTPTNSDGAVMPYIRAKPKVPTKPSNLSVATCANSNCSPLNGLQTLSPTDETVQPEQAVVHCTSPTTDSNREINSELSFQAKLATIANTLDLNKRNVKRQAPLPPAVQNAENEPAIQPRTARGMLVLPLATAHRPLQAWESDPGSSCPTSPNSMSANTSLLISQPERPAPATPSKKSPTLPTNSSLPNPCCGLRTKSPSLDSGSVGASRFPCLSSTHDYMKDMKKFKSKFSLKKLLKFGRDGEDSRSRNVNGNSQVCSSYGNMRTKSRIEILHPIDLANLTMQSNEIKVGETSGGNISYDIPNGNRCTNTHAVIEKQKSLPMSNGYNSSSFALSFSSTYLPSSVDSDEYADFSIAKKPSPPPRVKGIGLGPTRPPPPTPISISPCMSSDTDQGDYSYIQPVSGDIPSPQGEYANLGDARTPFVPKKPERNSPASCRRDTLTTDQSKSNVINGSQNGITGSSDENHILEPKDPVSRTYYEPGEMGMPSTHWEPSSMVAKMNQINNDSSSKRSKSKHRPAGIVWATSEDDSGDAGSEGSAENGNTNQTSRLESTPISALYAKVHKTKPVVNSDLRSTSPNDPLSSSLSEDEPSGTPPSIQCSHRLQLRKGRTVLPRGLHENYGAVVAANHEALAQLLDQVSQRRIIPCSVATTLKQATLRWSDFTLDNENPLGSLEHVSFYAATWNNEIPVTLMVTDELFPAPCSTRNPFIVCPIATFQDWVPSPPKNSCLQRGWVGVMELQKILPLSVYIQELRSIITSDVEVFERGAAILLLQFLSVLKHLQADGIEEVADDLSWVLVHKDDPLQFDWRLMLVPLEQATASRISLCECAVRMALHLLTNSEILDVPEILPNQKAFLGILELLKTEKAMSLSKAKAAVEFILWGPTGLVNIDTADCQEIAFQHWLDLERATTLSNLIRLQQNNTADFNPIEELHLLFLVRATARTLKEASAIVASSASTA